MKSLLAFLLLLLVCATALPHPAAAQSKLPTEAEVNASLKRTFGFDPSIAWRIVLIRPSAMPGFADVIVSMNQQPPQHIYVSADGKHAMIGEMAPWGTDPFAATRARLAGAAGIERGPAKSPLTLVAFTDLECADCKASQPVFDRLSHDFPQMRQVFLPVPLPVHPWSMAGAKYADCVGRANKAAFWPFLDAVFKAQDIIATDAVNQLKAMAAKAGADSARVEACVAAPETDKRIAASIALSQAIELDVDELPTAFINGRKVRNPASIPYEKLKTLVRFELAHAGK